MVKNHSVIFNVCLFCGDLVLLAITLFSEYFVFSELISNKMAEENVKGTVEYGAGGVPKGSLTSDYYRCKNIPDRFNNPGKLVTFDFLILITWCYLSKCFQYVCNGCSFH